MTVDETSNKFAKLFDLEDGSQVLISIVQDMDDDSYKVQVRTDNNGDSAKLAFGYANKKLAIDAIDNYTIKEAQKFRDSMMQTYFE